MINVLLVKLADGNELIGEIVEDIHTHILVRKPLQIHYRYFMGSVPHISFSRFMMFTAEHIVTLDARHILAVSLPRKAFIDFYQDNVEDYFGGIEQSIDNELIAALSTSQKDEQMKKLLESMPTDKAVIN